MFYQKIYLVVNELIGLIRVPQRTKTGPALIVCDMYLMPYFLLIVNQIGQIDKANASSIENEANFIFKIARLIFFPIQLGTVCMVQPF